MSFQTSFKQILKEKMGEQPNFSSVNESTLLSNDPLHLAFLMGTIARKASPSPRGHYPAPKVRPQRRPHTFTSQQQLSFEFLKSYCFDLSEGFTKEELKKAFRQTAMSLHPDHGGSTELFIQLKVHFRNLQSVFKTDL